MSACSSQVRIRPSGNRDGTLLGANPIRAAFAAVLFAILLLISFSSLRAADSRESSQRTNLTSVAEVMKLGNEQARARLPVQINGVITFSSEELNIFFIQDSSGGIFVDSGTQLPLPKSGNLVTVTGHTQRGRYNPIVTLGSFLDLGPNQFPDGQPATLSELWAGKLDCNWVSVRAYVRSHTVDGNLTTLKLIDSDKSVMATIANLPANWLP